MFLQLCEFGEREDALTPRVPSEIHEILIHRSVASLSSYLQAVYCTDIANVPGAWTYLYQPLRDIESPSGLV